MQAAAPAATSTAATTCPRRRSARCGAGGASSTLPTRSWGTWHQYRGRRAWLADPPAATGATGSKGRGGEALSQEDYGLFVRFLHMASPYVAGHRGRTFVVTIPGEVTSRTERLYPLLEDILLLHGLGVKLIIVCGAHSQITAYLQARGRQSQIVGAYRVTDDVAMQGAVEAAGTITTLVSAFLSKAPSIPVVRRHARSEGGQFHFAPAVQVVSGNYVTAKRRGIVNGVDFGQMGIVRFVQRSAIEQQLAAGNMVLLTNIGVSSSGELLNCNAFDVATHAAVELRADKLLILTGEDVRALNLPHYLPLDDAEEMITASVCGGDQECIMASLDRLGHANAAQKAERVAAAASGSDSDGGDSDAAGGWYGRGGGTQQQQQGSSSSGGQPLGGWHGGWESDGGGDGSGNGSSSSSSGGTGNGASPWQASDSEEEQRQRRQLEGSWQASQQPPQQHDQQRQPASRRGAVAELALDLDSWQSVGYPTAVLAAVVACKNGVKRAHLIDSESDGALLLEMYTRDGTPGVCMIAADLYEGIRPAEARDVVGVQQLLAMLAADGFSLPFPDHDVPLRLQDVTVIEREGKVLGCAVVCDLGDSADGVRVAELGAFCVHPAYRRAGFGDSLLDYVEQEMRQKGFRRVAIVAGQGSYEWFAQRDFARVGAAATSVLLPAWRQQELQAAAEAVPGAAPAQLLVKPIVELDASVAAPAGKRIGF